MCSAKPALSFTSVISFIHSKIKDNIHLDLYCLLSKIINLQTTVYSQDWLSFKELVLSDLKKIGIYSSKIYKYLCAENSGKCQENICRGYSKIQHFYFFLKIIRAPCFKNDQQSSTADYVIKSWVVHLTHLQWITQGPTSDDNTPALRTSKRNARKVAGDVGTPKSGQVK